MLARFRPLGGAANGGRLKSGAAVMTPILGVQCFLARTALGWNVSQLGRAAGVSYHTIQDFERGDSVRPSTVEAIQRALEKAGLIFIDANDGGPGARLGSQYGK
jgi:hypothetical protein